jgi:TPR repeat protein
MTAPVREPDDYGSLKDGPLKDEPLKGGSLKDGSLKGGPLKDGPLKYAPKRARRPKRDRDTNDAPREADAADTPRKSDAADASRRIGAAPQRGAPELPEPPWKRKKRQAFAGDIAVAELRTRLALAPDRLPDPPLPVSTVPKFGSAARLVGVMVVAAAGVVGYRWGSAPKATPPLKQFEASSNQADLVAERTVSTAYLRTPSLNSKPSAANDLTPGSVVGEARGVTNGATSVNGAPTASLSPIPAPPASGSPAALKAIAPNFDERKSPDPASGRAVSRQLTVDAVRLRQADEPARLSISAADAGANVAVVIDGLAPGSALSAGMQAGPNTWRLSTEDFNDAAITPPRGFVGIMDLTVELRLTDNTVVDRKGLQLEWLGKSALAPAKSQPRRIEAAEIALMVKNGTEFMANGNIGAARMMFQPAAEAGNPAAAFALAETYDPLVLSKLGAKGGITPDVALAHSWYEKAKELGSTVAPERLERLARLPE